MSNVGQKAILTQQQGIRFLRDQLGYDDLGNRTDCEANHNLEEVPEARPAAWNTL